MPLPQLGFNVSVNSKCNLSISLPPGQTTNSNAPVIKALKERAELGYRYDRDKPRNFDFGLWTLDLG